MESKSTDLTASIVAAYVANNPVPAAQLPELIASVNAAVRKLDAPQTAEMAARPAPAVHPKRSIFPDRIICLDDGKPFKSLKRHISALGMTPDQYRAKWDLPADYPMVAPNYSEKRSALAKAIGLGRASPRHLRAIQ